MLTHDLACLNTTNYWQLCDCVLTTLAWIGSNIRQHWRTHGCIQLSVSAHMICWDVTTSYVNMLGHIHGQNNDYNPVLGCDFNRNALGIHQYMNITTWCLSQNKGFCPTNPIIWAIQTIHLCLVVRTWIQPWACGKILPKRLASWANLAVVANGRNAHHIFEHKFKTFPGCTKHKQVLDFKNDIHTCGCKPLVRHTFNILSQSNTKTLEWEEVLSQGLQLSQEMQLRTRKGWLKSRRKHKKKNEEERKEK